GGLCAARAAATRPASVFPGSKGNRPIGRTVAVGHRFGSGGYFRLGFPWEFRWRPSRAEVVDKSGRRPQATADAKHTPKRRAFSTWLTDASTRGYARPAEVLFPRSALCLGEFRANVAESGMLKTRVFGRISGRFQAISILNRTFMLASASP